MRGAPFALGRLSALTIAATLFVAACGGGGATPTAAPAAQATTAAPKPTTAPAASPAVAASPSASVSASPAAKPSAAASPAASPAAAAAVPSPSAAPSAANLSGTIKIVSSLPRTGSSKGQTDTIVNAFKMALQTIGAGPDGNGGKLGGASIVFQDLDDATAAKGQWDAAQEAQNANQAVNDAEVMVYLGTFNSGAAKVSIPILCAANLGMTSPANTYPGLTKSISGAVEANEPDVYYPNCKRNYTRVVPTDEIQGAAAANWSKELGATKVYVLDDTQLYGHGIAVVYAATAPKVGLQVVGGPEGIDPQASDYRALAQKIRQSGADLVFFGGITQNNAGKLWQDLRDTLGNDFKLMGPDGILEQAFIDAAGPAAEGTYITFGGVPPNKLTGAGAQWYAQYKQQFNSEPEAYASYGYESMKVALDAIQRAGKADRAAIRDAIFGTRNFNGVLGTWSFTDTGDTTLSTMTGRQVKNGQFDNENAVTLQAPQ
jgi:branched-chain amino acid transport system substrate-binding protein